MLDVARLAPGITAIAEELSRNHAILGDMLREAKKRIVNLDNDYVAVAQKLDKSQTSWLVASFDPNNYPFQTFPQPDRPSEYIALATDGSQIIPDRNAAAHCCVLNLGKVVLRYGENAFAKLSSEPVVNMDDTLEDSSTEGEILSAKRVGQLRDNLEHNGLASLIAEYGDKGIPTVAFADGTLILWMVEKETDSVKSESLKALQGLFAKGRESKMPVVSYISRSGSRDVVNALRVLQCPFDRIDCDRNCPDHAPPMRRTAPCGGVENLTDTILFENLLNVGDRSAVFGSRSKILNSYEECNRIHFCYVHVGAEIARLEFPRWVAEDETMLNLVHTLAVNQAQKGNGYPRVLAEAHEQAVIRGADRDVFYHLLERALIRKNVRVRTTRKSMAKLSRTV